jgi:hypothetical protein
MTNIAEVELEFSVWLQFEDQMHKVGTVTGSTVELADLNPLREAIQDTLIQVSQELDGNAVIRLHVPAATS